MNNYCRNCGEKLESDTTVCPNCNVEVLDSRVNVDQAKNESEEYKKKENGYVIVVIALYAIPLLSHYLSFPGVYDFISYISPLLSLSATIILIYARITMNKSTKIRIMFNIFLTLAILYLLGIILIFMTCVGAFNKGCM